MSLVKYVLVLDSTDTWLTMENSYAEAAEFMDRHPGTHVEKWTYYELSDGTHGMPVKEQIKPK